MNSSRLKRLVRVQELVRAAKRADVAASQMEMGRCMEAVDLAAAKQRLHEAALRQARNWEHADLMMAVNFVSSAGEILKEAQSVRAEAAKDLEAKQTVLRGADQDVKRLERLEERVREAEMREARIREQRAMDEIASRRRSTDEN